MTEKVVNNKAKILVVDDIEDNLFSIKAILKKLDLEIFTALSGHEALVYIPKYKFAAIILDVQMPGMNGFDLALKIRKKYADHEVPIIFVTAINHDEKYVTKGYQLGAVDYLFKPIRSQALLSKVRVLQKLAEQKQGLADAVIKLQAEKEKNQLLLNCAHEGILGISKDGKIEFSNTMANDILIRKNSDQSLIGKEITQFLLTPDKCSHPNSDWKDSTIYNTCLGNKNYHINEQSFQRLDNSPFPAEINASPLNEDGKFIGIVFLFQDITIRKHAEEKLIRLSHFDQLTGLPNRINFYDHLEKIIKNQHTLHDNKTRQKNQIAVIFLDLDNFKDINDSISHAVGDQLLKNVTLRLDEVTGRAEMLARLGGDEFAIILNNLSSSKEASDIAGDIQQVFDTPFNCAGKSIAITCSIGIAIHHDQISADEIIRNADAAVYQAKEDGRNTFRHFEPSIYQFTKDKVELGAELSCALQKNEFHLHYQPKIDVSTGQIVGTEALIRWHHQQRGIISPFTFIPLAESSGLISSIGSWVLRQACHTAYQWSKIGLNCGGLTIAVNVSSIQLSDDNFSDVIEETLNQTGLVPEQLEIELTESALMKEPERCIKILEKIRNLGVKIAIDDFGTGYSSLSYLRHLPVDTLKIDKSFICDIDKNKHDESIVKTIIKLAHSLDLKVVAEGIETPGQLEKILDFRCDTYQGYYYSKPLPEKEILQLLSSKSIILK